MARLYNITNVPTAVWIDEAGQLVRPPENAGAYDITRHIDPETFEIPDDVAARGLAVRRHYFDAVRDWVARGAESPFALRGEELVGRLSSPSERDSLATAHFQLGAYLFRRGEAEAGRPHLEEAVRLRPESWTFRRQKIAIADEAAIGDFAATPEFWNAVQALGTDPYYHPIDMPGMPK